MNPIQTESVLGFNTHDNVITTLTLTGRNMNIMKRYSITTTILAASLAALTGCSSDPAEDSTAIRLDIKVFAAACAAANAPTECPDVRFCATHVDNPDSSVNPTEKGTCVDMDLSSGEASGSFASLDKIGWHRLAFVGLPEGQHVKYNAGGFVVNDMMELNRGVNTLSMIISDDTGTTSPGSGPVCLRGDPATDLATCVVKVNGVVQETADEDTENVCEDGFFLDNMPAVGTNFDIDCPDDNLAGSLNVGVAPNKVNDITVPLTDSSTSNPDPTALCLELAMSTGDPVNLANCKVTDIAWKELTSVAPPSGVCDGADELYFDDVKPGDRQISVKCDEGHLLMFYTFVAETLNNKSAFFAPAGNPGDACYKDIGDNVNVNKMALPLQAKLGHYAQNGTTCVLESDSGNYADWFATGLSDGGSCTQIGDSACLISAHGLAGDSLVDGVWYAHLVWETTPTELQTLPADGKNTHFLTFANSLVVPIVVKNGTVQEEPAN